MLGLKLQINNNEYSERIDLFCATTGCCCLALKYTKTIEKLTTMNIALGTTLITPPSGNCLLRLMIGKVN